MRINPGAFMNNLSQLGLIFFLLSGCSWAHLPESSDSVSINDYYGKAALFEMCSKSGVKKECDYVNRELNVKSPDIYFFQNGKQILVIYQIESISPYVVLAPDKDGYTEIISRGLWFEDKDEFIEAFIEEGSFSVDQR